MEGSNRLVGGERDYSYGTLPRSVRTSPSQCQDLSSIASSTKTHHPNKPQTFLIPPLRPVESFISLMSSSSEMVDDELNQTSLDQNRISQVIRETGSHAFGVIGLDVWIFDHGFLVHVPGGFWVNPVFAKRNPSETLKCLVDPNHPLHVTPLPQIPGTGLAGYFWSLGSKRMVWRELKAITSDPFQPPYPRMHLLEEAGFGKATGISFDIMGHRGVVVYMTRESASEALLNEAANVEYLNIAAQYIGAAVAFSGPLARSIEAKNSRITKKFKSVATKIQCVNAFSSLRRTLSSRSLNSLASSSPEVTKDIRRSTSFHDIMGLKVSSLKSEIQEWINKTQIVFKARFLNMLEKCHGSDIEPPPSVPFSNAIWTFLGSYITLLLLYGLSYLARHETGDTIVLAPFGALLTLQFSLTAAPASQPRSIIYGQIICQSMALFSKIVFMDIACWPLWMIVPLTTAGGIATMTKLGLAHPPAAAVIIALFTQPKFTLMSSIFVLIGNMMAIATAILVNNLSEKRQYPVYWRLECKGFAYNFHEALKQRAKRCKNESPMLRLRRKQSLDKTLMISSRSQNQSFSNIHSYPYVPINIHSIPELDTKDPLGQVSAKQEFQDPTPKEKSDGEEESDRNLLYDVESIDEADVMIYFAY
jgi:HPP family